MIGVINVLLRPMSMTPGGGGGLPPLDVISPSVETGNGQLTIRWTDPNDIEIEGTVVSTWAGTKLVRKVGSYPTSPSDGVMLVDN